MNLIGFASIHRSSAFVGTLIDQSNVLTAAHCILYSGEFENNGTTYHYNIEPNDDYKSIEDMYTVYLGIQKLSDITDDTDAPKPYVKRAVKRIIKVKHI